MRVLLPIYRGELMANGLNGDRTAEVRIVGFDNGAETTFAENSFKAVPCGEGDGCMRPGSCVIGDAWRALHLSSPPLPIPHAVIESAYIRVRIRRRKRSGSRI